MSERLERIELWQVAMPLVSAFRTSFGTERSRQCLIMQWNSDEGQGWGECVAGAQPGFSYETAGTAWHMLEQHFIPAILGQDLAQLDSFKGRIAHFRGHPNARAGLEMAWWDHHCRVRGLSLQKALGGKGERVAVGVSVGIQPDVDQLIEVVGSYLLAGYRRIKVKIEPGQDLVPVGGLRAAFPELTLQVDANAAYDPEDPRVLDLFLEMDDFGLLMIEQPFPEDNLLAHSRLQARLNTPLCLDESITNLTTVRQALDLEACRIVNIKAGRVGGLSEACAIHDECLQRQVPVWCGGMLETGVGRASNLALASLDGFSLPGDISSTARYYERDIARPYFELGPDSTLVVPQAPGLGVEIDRAALEAYSLRRASFEA